MNEKLVVLALKNQPPGPKFIMLYLDHWQRYFKNLFCYHHNFSVSITYVRISKIHD